MAATQGGVVTAAQCRAIGVDDPAVRRLLAAGLWTRARRGIYADATFVPWGDKDKPWLCWEADKDAPLEPTPTNFE